MSEAYNFKIISNSEDETMDLAAKLSASARAGEIYALSGDLGAGKTVFAKGFALGLGIDRPVTSPTFTILKIYDGGRLRLNHFDAYRIAEPGEMDGLGYEEYFFGDGVSLIEWPENIEELIPPDAVRIAIVRDPSRGESVRLITVSVPGGGRR